MALVSDRLYHVSEIPLTILPVSFDNHKVFIYVFSLLHTLALGVAEDVVPLGIATQVFTEYGLNLMKRSRLLR